MPLRLPAGKRLAVNIGVDFDAMCAFSGHMATLSPSILSRWLPPRRVILPALPKPRKVANGVPLPIARALSRSRHVI